MIKFDIAIGHSADSKVWQNKKFTWSAFVAKLSAPRVHSETFKTYKNASKIDQGTIKDCGGYVSGYLRGGRRGLSNVVFKQILTLDIDKGHDGIWDDFLLQYGSSAVIHSTHSHSPDEPRFRLLVPLDREATPEEYSAAARKVAESIGIEYFDETTFDLNRLMFWPSVASDSVFYFEENKGEFLNLDSVLAEYVDWTDVSSWATNKNDGLRLKDSASKQEDPTTKRGLVGAFCRTYSISEAVETFLSSEYIPGTDGRFTFTKGTTSNGVVSYDDKFAFSHHNTDPAGGHLSNSFDLVRLHKFGHLDANPQSRKSFSEMVTFSQNDKGVKKTIARELLQSAKAGFGAPDDLEESDEEVEELDVEESVEWMAELETNAKGEYLSNSGNINLIVLKDLRLRGVFAYNVFDAKRYLMKSTPWRNIQKPEPLRNVDLSGVRNYIECLYGIAAVSKIDDALNLEFERNKFNPVLDYLEGLKWDGKPRVDSLLIDYFGVEDSPFTREAMRKTLVGGVARIFEPGVKFDTVLVIVGGQGEGKSQFIARLGGDWFSDTFITVHGKEALEQIQGAWVIEIAELAGLRKADVEAVKHFVAKQVDTFRPAYQPTAETYRRQCIFIATTNIDGFLRDATGNRRFWPVKTRFNFRSKDTFKDLTRDEVGQIWGEAVDLYKKKESLILTVEANIVAKAKQVEHSESDDRAGLIGEYLERLLPKNWDKLALPERRIFLDDPASVLSGTISRDYVCIAEIWSECLRKEKQDLNRYNSREINDLMRSFPDWEPNQSTKNFAIYGKQKFYIKSLL
jgi:putative DNA primase/helicase